MLETAESRQALAGQIVSLSQAGWRVVVVHGGGKQLSGHLKRQGIESEFRGGLRVTAPEVLDSVLQIFAGSVNHRLVAALNGAGARAVGLSGIDAGLVTAEQLSPELGAVGRVERVDARLLDLLTANEYLPVVACVAGGPEGAIFNVNADQMAVACAAGFGAEQLIFLTDVEGVLDSQKRRIGVLTPAAAGELIRSGVAQGGMEAKLRAACAGLEQGVGKVRIVAGAAPGVLERVLAGGDLGTTLTPA